MAENAVAVLPFADFTDNGELEYYGEGIAEEVTKVHAVCTVCGASASRSQRLIPEGTTVLVGGSEAYEARCRSCFEPREVRRTVHPDGT